MTQRKYPPGAVTLKPTRVAVLQAVHDGAGSFRDVAATTGISVGSAYPHAVILRRVGLLDWEPGKVGTLRPGPLRPIPPL